MSKRQTPVSERRITLVIEANGQLIKRAIGSSPLQQLTVHVSTADGRGREELVLHFELDVRPGTGHPPEVPDPE